MEKIDLARKLFDMQIEWTDDATEEMKEEHFTKMLPSLTKQIDLILGN